MRHNLLSVLAMTALTAFLFPGQLPGQQARTGKVVLHAIDIESGKPMRDVVFFKSNSHAEDWFVELGTTDPRGQLSLESKPIPGYYFSVWSAPAKYRVVSLDDVASDVVPGETVHHRFYLRKDTGDEGFPKIKNVPPDSSNRVPAPTEQDRHFFLLSTVEDMPGFEGRQVKFSFHPHNQMQKQQQLAERIFYNGLRVAAAVKDELQYFQKAVPEDKGKIEDMTDILIEIDGPRNWRFWCRLPGGLRLRQHGYRVHFSDLKSWDLNIPDHLQPGF